MELEELVCSLCQQYFNEQENIPRMLPACGHTFCSKCIQNIMDKLPANEIFICPEDQVPWIMDKKEVNIFPKNYILLRLIEKKKSILPINPTKTRQHHDDNFTTKKPLGLNQDKIAIFQNSPLKFDVLKTPPPSSSSSSNMHNYYSPHHNKPLTEITNFDPNIMCKEHSRRLEIICMDHKCRICSKCALFGSHKNHDIRGEEEILKEIAMRAECILDILQIIDENQHKMFDQTYFDKIKMKIKTKHNQLTETLHQKFDEYINIIKMKEKKILDDMNQKFNILEQKFNEVRQLPKDITEKIQKWKLIAQDQLTILSQKTEKHEIAFELLQDKFNIKGDIVVNGEKVLQELNRVSEIPFKSLDEVLNSSSLIFQDNPTTLIDNLCGFITNISSEFTINWTPKQNLESPPSQLISSHEGLPNGGISSNNANYVTTSAQPNHFFDEENRKSFFGDKKFDEDLLNFNMSNLSLIEIPESSFLEPSRKASPRSSINITGPMIMNFYDKPPKNPDSTGVSISANYDRLLANPEKASMHRSVSPPGGRYDGKKRELSPIIKKVDSLNNSQDDKPSQLNTPNKIHGMNDQFKSNNKKKMNFKIPEKYEATIEAMKLGNIENIDLTGAGDVGLGYICDIISKSKGIRSLKLVKNKITDEGLQTLVKILSMNITITNLNLTQNLLSDKSLDILISLFNMNKTIKKLYLNQNQINIRNSKAKIKEMNNLGVEVYL